MSVPAPSKAGAVTRCRGGKGRPPVKLRTLKDGHRKYEISPVPDSREKPTVRKVLTVATSFPTSLPYCVSMLILVDVSTLRTAEEAEIRYLRATPPNAAGEDP